MTNVHDRLTCSGFEISIKVDGIKSTTYSVQHTQGDEQASCWISSEADKEFSIVLCRKAFEEYDFTAEIFLDGHKAVYYVFKNETGRTSGPRTISCTRTSPTEVRKFAFGTLELTDDDAHLNMPSANSIGEIKVLIQRVKTTSVLSGFAPKVFDVPNLAKVHERSKKGLTHRIQYGPAHQRSASHRSYKYERYGRPITFIFNYRPLRRSILFLSASAPTGSTHQKCYRQRVMYRYCIHSQNMFKNVYQVHSWILCYRLMSKMDHKMLVP
ncbi:hypothetical protein BDN70DRAFT_249191 [Pholiota conissans]|uniref:DUF7918 domain-containing protein n=1 Tax=Pholiota conissans TaxID=109636 RepID=A0A9P5YTF2_9AGAR|nr:hypothetical protein BDN70DRAFT_249191 [Pholiota conissans]